MYFVRRPVARPRSCWRDYIVRLAWEHIGILQEELEHHAAIMNEWKKINVNILKVVFRRVDKLTKSEFRHFTNLRHDMFFSASFRSVHSHLKTSTRVHIAAGRPITADIYSRE